LQSLLESLLASRMLKHSATWLVTGDIEFTV
jgi:hypothetical protein